MLTGIGQKLLNGLELVVWLLPPSRLKNFLLRFFGHEIDSSASLGPTIVSNVGRFRIGKDVRFGLFNVIRGLNHAWFEDNAVVESWNWISAHPIYRDVDPGAGTFYLGYCAKLGSRHYLDSSGTIVVREYGIVGGNRCFFQTHQPDYVGARQTVGRITIGHHSMVGSSAVLLKGASLPDQSLLAANSTMTHKSAPDEKPGLYAGSPATWKRETDGEYFSRRTQVMTEHVVDEPMGVRGEDLPSGRYALLGQDRVADMSSAPIGRASRRRFGRKMGK